MTKQLELKWWDESLLMLLDDLFARVSIVLQGDQSSYRYDMIGWLNRRGVVSGNLGPGSAPKMSTR